MKKVEIKKVTTSEENISDRSISYDVYIDGVYTKSFEDVIDAIDFKEDQKLIDRFWFQYNNGGSFTKNLTHAIAKADLENLRKLKKAYPDLVDGYTLHHHGRRL